MLIIGILSIPIVAEKIDNYSEYRKAIYLFENNEYDLQELIEKNNLTEQEPLMSYCFDTNEKIKELAKNLTTVYEVQRWILEFPYNDIPTYIFEFKCQQPQVKATEILKNGKGNCVEKSILVCSIFYEKNISCYIISNNKLNHSISIIYYNNAWRPILTTGYINKNNINKFMNSLFLIESKNERYFRNI